MPRPERQSSAVTSDRPVRIRTENTGNLEERLLIRAVNEAAFGRSDEADLVDQLRRDRCAMISLVAELGHEIAGHIMFSRMWIKTSTGLTDAAALAPVAVLPNRQRQGIGTLLIQHGLQALRDRGEQIVIVAGHPDYYPRFGFSTEKAMTLASPFPPEALMAMDLVRGALDGVQGSVVYPPPFGIPES